MSSISNPLWQQIIETTKRALSVGALQPISTQLYIVPDQGLQFCVRVLDSLERKEKAKTSPKLSDTGKPANPFLPYEEDLWVTHLSETHACLLNKFNVVDHHILMVTRHYESQDAWLTFEDFDALGRCLIAIDGLGFYNGGKQAGASQHHKHLQLVPFSNEAGHRELPITHAIDAQRTRLSTSMTMTSLPFHHGVKLLDVSWLDASYTEVAEYLLVNYQQLTAAVGLNLETPSPTIPYNLLVTRAWMMLVPRSQESYASIGVNSLGYAGWLLTKSRDTLETLKAIGPMQLLQAVGVLNPI